MVEHPKSLFYLSLNRPKTGGSLKNVTPIYPHPLDLLRRSPFRRLKAATGPQVLRRFAVSDRKVSVAWGRGYLGFQNLMRESREFDSLWGFSNIPFSPWLNFSHVGHIILLQEKTRGWLLLLRHSALWFSTS